MSQVSPVQQTKATPGIRLRGLVQLCVPSERFLQGPMKVSVPLGHHPKGTRQHTRPGEGLHELSHATGQSHAVVALPYFAGFPGHSAGLMARLRPAASVPAGVSRENFTAQGREDMMAFLCVAPAGFRGGSLLRPRSCISMPSHYDGHEGGVSVDII